MEENLNKEQYSKLLIKKAQKAVKIIKLLVAVAGALAGVLLVFGILALTVIKDTNASLIGFIVILVVIAAVFVALIALFVYAKINQGKLKKLN